VRGEERREGEEKRRERRERRRRIQSVKLKRDEEIDR
jgi:hypothetical protein